MTPRDGENLTVTVLLDPTADKSGAGGADGKGDQAAAQKAADDKKKAEQAMKDMDLRLALLENTVSIIKTPCLAAVTRAASLPSTAARRTTSSTTSSSPSSS